MTTALMTKNFGHVSAAPGGISMLRELILKLAVQGRLTGWAFRADSDGNLQTGWRFLKLPDAATYRIGKTPPSKEARHWDAAGIPWVSISDMTHFKTVTETARKVSKTFAGETFKYEPVPAGSLLMSFKLTVGKVAILGVAGYHNEAIISMQPKEGLSRDYLMRVLPAIAQSGRTRDALMGATLNSSSLAELVVPVPSLKEQHRIVAKVDELMGLCDRLEAEQADAEAAHAKLVDALLASLIQARDAADFRGSWQQLAEHFHTLFTNEASVDALKQTVLQLAVTGRLLPQEASFLDGSEKSIGSIPLPRHWEVTPFNDLVDQNFPIAYGVLVPGPEDADGVPFVRIADLSLNAPPQLPEKKISRGVDAKFSRTRLVGGEILMGVVGSIGKLGIAPPSWAGANIARAICRIVPAPTVCREFILWLLQSDLMRNQFIGDTRTLAQPTLNVGLIRAARTPVPPLEEQQRIVEVIDRLMALCDELQRSLVNADRHHENLASVLVAQTVA